MVDFTTYKAPGVYVQDVTGPIVSPFGVPSTVVCLIGPAIGYQSYGEVVTIPSTGTVALQQHGIFLTEANGHPAPKVTLLDGTLLVADTDYALSTLGTDNEGTVTGIGKGTAASPGSVIITYAFARTNYYAPQVFDDYDSIAETYGAAMIDTPSIVLDTSQVNSPLTLAAKIAIENGANRLVCVATDPSADDYQDALNTAYTQVLSDPAVNVLVPLFLEGLGGASDMHTYNVVKGFTDDLITHCAAASEEGFGRIGIIGLPSVYGSSSSNQAFIDLASEGRGTGSGKRLVIAYPNMMNYYNGLTNQTTAIDGCFLAAAYAGRLAALPVQKPLTKELIRGFLGIPSSVQKVMTRSFKDGLSKNGVMVTEVDRQNRLSIRHGVTTDTSSIITRELSIVRARDVLFEMCLVGTEESGLIGIPIDQNTPLQVKSAVINVLESAVSGGVIVQYQDVLVRQQTLPAGDPTVIEVKFSYLPAIPLNYIVIKFAIDLNSGNTTLTNETQVTTTG